MTNMPSFEQLRALRDAETKATRELGERIGYGNMMHLASDVWER